MEASYQLTKKQILFREMVKNLVQKRIAPRVAEVDQSAEFPGELNKILAQNRLLALVLPKEHGGEGAGFLDFCLVLEEMGKVCPASALICMLQNMGCRLILKNGNQGQKSYLPRMAGGQLIFGFALNEAASLDLADVPVEAVKRGQEYVLNGGPFFMANGDVADMITVFFRMGGAVSGLLLEKGTTAYSVTKTEGLTGSEARYGCKAVFKDCRIPLENLLGQEGEGLKVLTDFAGEMGCSNAARAVGLAQGSLDYAITYAKNRVQFGRPIIQFQAMQSLLAGMTTKVEAARQLLYKAASLLDQANKEAIRFAAMAKYFASEAAMSVSLDGVQIAGGYGYMKDYPLEKIMRNAKLTQITEGTNQLQQLIIAKYL
jgi:alkylation response protein AidB-like acyl-CoA dehydrogenase